MARDSLFGETILWSGRPGVVSSSPMARLVIASCSVLALASLSFATVAATALSASVSGLILFSGWCAAAALFAHTWPRFWRSGVEYVVTERHVIWRRGPIRRSIDRDSISYALIRWNPNLPGTGDLVLVRAVPTGALRRTLSVTLSDVLAPDRVWAIVRGLTPSASQGAGDCPLPQRLDEGERVLWSGTPLLAPWTTRRSVTGVVALGVAIGASRSVVRVIPLLRRIAHLHALPAWSFGLIVVAVALSIVFAVAVAAGVGYAALVRPRRLLRATRYLVTNRRVLIRRGREELSLDRDRIADVIPAPTRAGAPALVDLFLVLDGPHARAFSSSGAFRDGEREHLHPVLLAIEDADTVGAILRGVVTPAPMAVAA
jgi:hypothetical protein